MTEEREVRMAEALLETVRLLESELHPQEKATFTLDSSLTRDLGFDSLSQMELLSRLEKQFGVRLPEGGLFSAETPRDLLRALRAGGTAVPVRPATAQAVPSSFAIPDQAHTLLEVLDWHVGVHPDRPHIRLVEEQGFSEITYRELFDGASAVSAGLRARGLQPGQTVALMLSTEPDFFYACFGIMMAGGIPVPLYPPFRLSDIEDHLHRQAGILSNAKASRLITSKRFLPLLRPLLSLDEVISVADLSIPHSERRRILQPHSIAFLQYTSGSTGQPKGAVLTQANILANIRALGLAAEVKPSDVFVSWMPLYHDMGLVGAWLASLYYGMLAVLLSPLTFLARPERWLWAIHEHKGTLTGAPNFAYELCARRIRERAIEGLDLCSLRLAVSGAELVSPATIARFSERFQKHGFKPEAFAPAYGLAESTVGLSLTPVGRGPRIDRILRVPFLREGIAEPAGMGDVNDADSLLFVSCGKPLPGHRIRIVAPDGRVLPGRTVGKLEFKGPSSILGYYRDPESTRKLFHDGWLDSGDLAYLAGGEVYLTGRAKDLIIRAGHNLYPNELEERVGEIPGILKDGVAVFGSSDPNLGTERIVVFAETEESDPSKLEKIESSIVELSREVFEVPASDVVFGPLQSLPRTASGKIRHSTCRELYEQGKLGLKPPVWRQFASLLLAGVGPRLRRTWHRLGALLYAGYAWFLFGLFAPIVWVSVVLLPDLSLRRKLVRVAARLFVGLLGLRLSVNGQEALASCCPCVLVANHASYLDALMLVASLPPGVTYTPHREFNFLNRLFLEHLGVHFVDRLDPQGGLKDTKQVIEALRRGESILFFPEGGFFRESGLRPFRMGAFLAAAQSGASVLPLGIKGTRSLLPPYSWFPHRGEVTISFGKPIAPKASDWASAVEIREAAFGEVLGLCEEVAIE